MKKGLWNRSQGGAGPKSGQCHKKRERHLAVLYPKANRTPMRIGQLTLRIGMKEGETGKEKNIKDETGSDTFSHNLI